MDWVQGESFNSLLLAARDREIQDALSPAFRIRSPIISLPQTLFTNFAHLSRIAGTVRSVDEDEAVKWQRPY
jgi:hypothetical protein